MKTLFLTLVAIIFSVVAFGQVNPNNTYVNGYYRSNGTYVKGHFKTKPNNTNRDNYTTYPNVNPWTGSKGYVKPDNGYNPYGRSSSSYNSSKSSAQPFGSTSYSLPSYSSRKKKSTVWPY